VWRDNQLRDFREENEAGLLRSGSRQPRALVAALTTVILLAAIAGTSLWNDVKAGSPDQIPSNVAWTPETIAKASSGNAFRGMLLAKRCEHCHGAEGFSPVGSTPNLAGMDTRAIWKQLEDFRDGKRSSPVMEPIAQSLSQRDVADVVAYYAELPVYPDPQDNRVFPETNAQASHSAIASRLVAFGEGSRGIPPCQSCHGPVGYKAGAPSLATQNSDYILAQLDAFSEASRANDINEPMRTIAALLSENERQALAAYYGAGLGLQPVGASGIAPKR
jgi:cytochrome c553